MQKIDFDEWNNFVSNSKWGDILQFSYWANVKSKYGWKIRYISSDDMRVRSIVFIKKVPIFGNILYVPHGPIFHDVSDLKSSIGNWLKKVSDFAYSINAFCLDIEPKIGDLVLSHELDDVHKKNLDGLKHFYNKDILEVFLQNGFKLTNRNTQPKYKLLYNLRLSEDELLALMHKNTRYNIRYAKRKGVVVKKYDFDSDEIKVKIEKFYELLKITQKRTGGYPIRPKSFFFDLYFEFKNSKNLALFEASFDGDVIAMNISERTDNWSSSFYAGSNRLHPKVKAMYLLRWKSILWAKSFGSTVYDFWGIIPNSKQHKGYSDHKLSFKGARIDHVGILQYMFDEKKAKAFNTLIPLRSKLAQMRRKMI